MQTQRTANWLPLSLIVLAAAILVAGFLIANSISTASQVQLRATGQTTQAIEAVSLQAQSNAFAAQQGAQMAAQHQANLQSVQPVGPSAIDQLTAANQAAMRGR
jgi:uncharacterized protein (UPF0333 family)